ncbi:hypothetical protein K493DRAFT_285763 [Basidiobolus meristosporus CBS 931.73]|uniref:Ras-domain-containing protein n=1 Tax=Basidiobolus meristosporus CBS 931.73 TaxID=1314790 RepID=A0A1Y1Y334_9FUNG|nr:hypothetical protein K493DRAFT_285763 [Basidiobolus meristosporus CBS 931.73]|eukprot:ORX92431.1 hypothetical protein K493DRAFT_285763 [Basidiobolus meristosporus CBS 931.73]
MAEDLIIHIVGSKFDLANTRREVSPGEVTDFLEKVVGAGYTVHEVSAKENEGVDEVFIQIARQLVENKFELERARQYKTDGSIYLNDEDQETAKSRCCN